MIKYYKNQIEPVLKTFTKHASSTMPVLNIIPGIFPVVDKNLKLVLLFLDSANRKTDKYGQSSKSRRVS